MIAPLPVQGDLQRPVYMPGDTPVTGADTDSFAAVLAAAGVGRPITGVAGVAPELNGRQIIAHIADLPPIEPPQLTAAETRAPAVTQVGAVTETETETETQAWAVGGDPAPVSAATPPKQPELPAPVVNLHGRFRISMDVPAGDPINSSAVSPVEPLHAPKVATEPLTEPPVVEVPFASNSTTIRPNQPDSAARIFNQDGLFGASVDAPADPVAKSHTLVATKPRVTAATPPPEAAPTTTGQFQPSGVGTVTVFTAPSAGGTAPVEVAPPYWCSESCGDCVAHRAWPGRTRTAIGYGPDDATHPPPACSRTCRAGRSTGRNTRARARPAHRGAPRRP